MLRNRRSGRKQNQKGSGFERLRNFTRLPRRSNGQNRFCFVQLGDNERIYVFCFLIMDRKKIAILGATGSIGSTALNIVRKYPHKFEVRLLVNAADKENLIKLVKEFKPQKAFCVNADFTYGFERNERASIDSPKLYQDIDLVINGIAGIAGLRPSIAVIQAGKTLATANKESFVAAGKLIDEERKKYSSKILPLDSEHSTVWQCVNGRTDNIKRIILTASGGAFRDYNYEELKQAKAVDALKHPNWVMGKKVTIDSATLMNKGMEIIEAKYFFGVSDIDVVMHRGKHSTFFGGA